MEIVPPHDETCDVCAGKKDRAPQKSGKRWSERGTVRRMCRACYHEFLQGVGRQRDIVRDPVRRKIELPDEPDQA
jgi:hypothetical protein